MKKSYLIPIFAILFIGSILFVASLMNNSNQGNNLGDSITYGSNVCISTTGNFEGRDSSLGELELVECSHNVLYDTGAEAIEQYLGAGLGGGDAFDWIELCDETNYSCGEPQADKSEDYDAWVGCGMDNVAGTYGSLGNGNWSVYKLFTSTCPDVLTNSTRLRNDDDDDLAGNSFTLVTLQIDDQLLVNWTVWVE